MKQLFLMLCATLLTGDLWAQTAVNGSVFDAFSKKPINNAKVTGPKKETAFTDSLGHFSIQLKDNPSTITFEHVAYQTLKVEINPLFKRVHIFVMEAKINQLDEFSVSAIRAGHNSPTAYTNLDKEAIEEQNFGQDMPVLLSLTPSTVVSSDAGAGVGYTGIRIRGVDPTRTNVTINGIPINDAESQGVYWVNMPDFASSTQSIQVQRGVGTSTNGAAAFGSSINIQTDNLSNEPYLRYSGSGGSFNTLKNTLEMGTGLLNDKFSFNARYSKITSDGFIDRASSDLQSLYVAGGYYGKNTSIKFNVFSGKEKTYQAWNGIPQPKFENDTLELQRYYEQLYITGEDSVLLADSDPNTYNQYTYDNQTDNYQQDHYQLFLDHNFKNAGNLHFGLHYTRGRGYYEQYRKGEGLSEYGLNPVVTGNDTVYNTDLVRRLWLDNHFGGMVFSYTQKIKNFNNILGGAANIYQGDHYGTLRWLRFASNSEIADRYYFNDAMKNEGSIYYKLEYNKGKVYTFLDLQFRGVQYKFEGPDRNGNLTDQDTSYLFFNPKVGASYKVNNNSMLYASVAIGQREPVRNDFVNSSSQSRPEPEELYDMEFGYKYFDNTLNFSTNFYYMYYINQLVLTGAVNDVGAYTRENVDKSFRSGLETELSINISKKFQLAGNLTYSVNQILNYTHYLDDYANNTQVAETSDRTPIAFSPSTVASAKFRYSPLNTLNLDLIFKHVGRQYLDNTGNEDKSLDAFQVFNFAVNYSVPVQKGVKRLLIGAQVNNLLNHFYAPNGYTFGWFDGTKEQYFNYVYPQAGSNFMFRLMLEI